MRRRMGAWLITAALLVVLGLILFSTAMTAYRWDFAKLSTEKYEINTHEIAQVIRGITVLTDTADIVFLPSEDGTCRVVCKETENVKHAVSVNDGVLVIRMVDEREWRDYIGIHLDTQQIAVYLPWGGYDGLAIESDTGKVRIGSEFRFENIQIKGSTGDVQIGASCSGAVSIKTDTGGICVEGISAGGLELEVSTGRILVSNVICQGNARVNVSTGRTEMTNVVCRNLFSEGNTGEMEMVNVIASGEISIVRTTGDVSFDGCDAGEIAVHTDTGDVTGSLLTEKRFLTQSDTGSIQVPESAGEGRCEITTDTGDIRIRVGQ